MYSRLFDSPHLIIIRTIILLLIVIGEIVFTILIRDWRQIQVSRLRQRAIKTVNDNQSKSFARSSNNHYQRSYDPPTRPSMMSSNYQQMNRYSPSPNRKPIEHHYEQIENPYVLISPSSSGAIYSKSSNQNRR
ncbi:hypothetical protein SSS_09028 [Sarcoptes scabiei]|nr:hypothetical protein SSS_09028 [Sarcoptes scabiei]